MVNRVIWLCVSRDRKWLVSNCFGVMYSSFSLLVISFCFICVVVFVLSVELRYLVCMFSWCRVLIWFCMRVISGEMMMLVLLCSREGIW